MDAVIVWENIVRTLLLILLTGVAVYVLLITHPDPVAVYPAGR